MADIIKLLPDHVANQIAAGEVVQRPASVVKELLENAIDAQSDTIKLIIKDGGKSLIQVVDDGIGMSPTDARLSFERHATSKIQQAEDLFKLSTKGFRGEALASIAAVAHVAMHTRPESEEVGTHLRIEGSQVVAQEMAATAKGTSLAVKNLFFNIPARRNFLKSDQVELRHIIDEFHRVALAHPGIAFHFYHNGNELFNLPKTNNRQRIVQIFGHKTNAKLVPVSEDTQVVRIQGFVVKPEFAKKSRGEQFFFVNDRFIKSPYLHHAITNAFEGVVKPDLQPGYFLYLEVDPATLDINIHPTKTEVKFEDEHTLYAILRSTVKHSLGQFQVAPALDFDRDPNLDTPYAYKDKGAVLPKVTVDAGFNPFAEEKVKTGNAAVASRFTHQKATHWESMYTGLATENEEEGASLQFESESISGGLFEDGMDTEETSTMTFQIKRKYIITTIKSGLVVIDQGRAHQRILYERFLKDMTIGEGVSQQLLFPVDVSLNPMEVGLLKEIRPNLEQVGYVFGAMEDETVSISGVPAMVSPAESGAILEEFIAAYGSGTDHDGFSQTDFLAKTLARTLAVKTGDALDETSRTGLVNDLFACKDPLRSPFNKPVFITLTEKDIDKRFM